SFLSSLTCSPSLPLPHSFPTRRSSDLATQLQPVGCKPDTGRLRIAFHCQKRAALVCCARSNHCTGCHFFSCAGSNWRRHYLALRSEEHTSELQSRENLVCRLLLEKNNL